MRVLQWEMKGLTNKKKGLGSFPEDTGNSQKFRDKKILKKFYTIEFKRRKRQDCSKHTIPVSILWKKKKQKLSLQRVSPVDALFLWSWFIVVCNVIILVCDVLACSV